MLVDDLCFMSKVHVLSSPSSLQVQCHAALACTIRHRHHEPYDCEKESTKARAKEFHEESKDKIREAQQKYREDN